MRGAAEQTRTARGQLPRVVLGLCAALGCGGGSGTESPPPPPQLIAIDLSRSADTIVQIVSEHTIGITLRYQASVAPEADIHVTSSNTSVVRLDTTVRAAQGAARFSYHGLVPGTTTLTAASGTFSAQLAVTVLRQGIASVEITPPFAQLAVDDSVQLHARAIGLSGDEVQGVPITWSSANAAVATVSAAGVVTGTGLGTTSIAATEGEGGKASHISTVVVLPRLVSIDISPSPGSVLLGGTRAFSATGVDRKGRRYPGVPATWTTDDTSRLLLLRSDSVAVGVAHNLGQTTIRAVANEGQGALPVTVVANPVTRIGLNFGGLAGWDGDSLHMWSGDLATGYAQPFNAAGDILIDRPIQWSTSDPTVASVSSAGTIHAVAAGAVTITATVDGFSASAPGRVRLTPPVVSVQVGSAFFTRVVGQSLKMHATVLGVNDSVMANRSVTWTSSNSVVARFTDDNVLTALSSGTTQVTAASGGKTSDVFLLTVVNDAASSQWNPQIRFDGPEYAPLADALRRAVIRLRQAIQGDVPDVPLDLPRDACYTGSPSITQNVDDIIVLVHYAPQPDLLGTAGTCVARSQGSLPVVGLIVVDTLTMLSARQDAIDNAMLHDLLHASGMSFSVWNSLSLWTGPVADPAFNGPTAQAAFRALGGARYPYRAVPLSEGNTGVDSYIEWRTFIMKPEMFSLDIFDDAVLHPLSAITVSALGDLGYSVAMSGADDFHLGPQVPLLPRVSTPIVAQHHSQDVPRLRFRVDARGVLTPVHSTPRR